MLEYLVCVLTFFSLGLLSIYTYICVCVGAPLFIRWDIDGDIHSFFVTLRWWLMVSRPFNGRKAGKCFVTARGWTRVTLLVLSWQPSLGWWAWRYYSSLIMIVDNIGGLVGPINCPLIPGVVQTFRRSQEYEEVCLFSHRCTYLVGCD